MKKLKILSKISLYFRDNKDFDIEMNEILNEVGNFLGISRIRIFMNPYKDITLKTYEWCNEGIESEIKNLQNLKWEKTKSFKETLSKKGYIGISDISVLPEDLMKILKNNKIKDLLFYPLMVKEEIFGFISFESYKYKPILKEKELEIISILSSVISSGYEKKFMADETDKIVYDNYKHFFETIDDMFIVSDIDGNIINFNASTIKRLGYSYSEFTNMNLLDLHPKDKREEAAVLLGEMLKKERKYCPIPFISKSKEVFSVESRVWKGTWNKKDCIYSISKDLTKENEDFQIFSKIFENNPLPMSITDMKDNTFIKVNPAFVEKTGYNKEDLYGKTVEQVGLFTNIDKIKNAIEYRLNEKMIKNEEVCLRLKDGSHMRGLFSMENMTIQGKESFLTVIIDLTERVEYERKILDLSHRDSLTNVYNRRYIYSRANNIIEEYKRTGIDFSVCIIDIDKFKRINDSYGHQIGDCVLKEFTTIIEKKIRLYDLLGRYGGEEFIVILKNSDIKKGTLIMKRILKHVKDTEFVFDSVKTKFTFSAGISNSSEFEKENLTIDNLVKLADKRMYIAKNSGGNKVINSSM